MRIDHYTYRVSWSVEDGEHIATCAEFPSLSWLASDPIAALQGLRDLLTSVIADMNANGEPIPEPLAERAFSGKFQVRTTPELHRQLTIEAAEAGVSMNRLVNHKLSAPLSAATGSRPS